MSPRARGTLAVMAVTLGLMATAAAPAAARIGIGIAPAGPIEATSEGRITFRGGAGVQIYCEMTFTGMILPLVRKVRGVPFGTITAAATRGCEGRVLVGTPTWIFLAPIPMVYESFLGTLPEISGILVRFQPMNFRINEADERGRLLAECLYEGNVGALFPVALGVFERFRFLEAERVRLKAERSRGLENCEANGVLMGTFRIRPPQRITLLDREGIAARDGLARLLSAVSRLTSA